MLSGTFAASSTKLPGAFPHQCNPNPGSPRCSDAPPWAMFGRVQAALKSQARRDAPRISCAFEGLRNFGLCLRPGPAIVSCSMAGRRAFSVHLVAAAIGMAACAHDFGLVGDSFTVRAAVLGVVGGNAATGSVCAFLGVGHSPPLRVPPGGSGGWIPVDSTMLNRLRKVVRVFPNFPGHEVRFFERSGPACQRISCSALKTLVTAVST